MTIIDQLEGIELREAVAREVMGLEKRTLMMEPQFNRGAPLVESTNWWEGGIIMYGPRGLIKSLPCYESSIEAAWQVAEKMRESAEGWALRLFDQRDLGDGQWRADFVHGQDHDKWGDFHSAKAATAPLAISRAALRAIREAK